MSKRLFVIVFLLCTEKSVCKHTKRLTTESSRRRRIGGKEVVRNLVVSIYLSMRGCNQYLRNIGGVCLQCVVVLIFVSRSSVKLLVTPRINISDVLGLFFLSCFPVPIDLFSISFCSFHR